MMASRISHSTSSNGWTPSLVKYRRNVNPTGLAPSSCSFVATLASHSVGSCGEKLSTACRHAVENHTDVIRHSASATGACQGASGPISGGGRQNTRCCADDRPEHLAAPTYCTIFGHLPLPERDALALRCAALGPVRAA